MEELAKPAQSQDLHIPAAELEGLVLVEPVEPVVQALVVMVVLEQVPTVLPVQQTVEPVVVVEVTPETLLELVDQVLLLSKPLIQSLLHSQQA